MAIDIKKLENRYYPTRPTKQLVGKDNFSKFVERRFYTMAWARNDWYQRVQRTYKLWDVFQPWLLEGESFSKAVRFPTLRDAAKAIKDEILKAPPEAALESDEGEYPHRAQALEFALKDIKDNIYEKRVQADCLLDMLHDGIGYRYVGYYNVRKVDDNGETKVIHWDNVGTERIDPRHVYWDEQGRHIWDPKHRDFKRDCILKYVYPYSTFLDMFNEIKGIQNLDAVEPFPKPISHDISYPTDRELEEKAKVDTADVNTYVYYNQEEGMYGIVANGITILEPQEIPNDHGRIPMVSYEFEKRPDGFYPQSLAELIAPHIYAQDTVFNLELMGLKMDLMPATMIDSDLGYNKKLHKFHPRAVWEMNVPPGKSLRDSIHPFQRTPRDSQGFYNMNSLIESQLTVTSGHDRKALYLSPNELATQTAAKKQTAEKSVNALVYANELEAEGQMTELMVSDIKQYLTAKREVMINGQKTKRFRKIKVEGYVVKQNDEGDAMFEPAQGENSIFDMTQDSVDTDVKVKVKDMRTKLLLQEQKVGRMMQFLPVVTNFVSAMSAVDPTLLKKLDASGIVEQLAEAMDMDLKRTIRDMDNVSYDIIQREHAAMLAGVEVPVPVTESYEDSLLHKKQHERFRWVFRDNRKTKDETVTWKNASQLTKALWLKHYVETLMNIRTKILPVSDQANQEMSAINQQQGYQQAAAQPGQPQPMSAAQPQPNPQLTTSEAGEKKVATAGLL